MSFTSAIEVSSHRSGEQTQKPPKVGLFGGFRVWKLEKRLRRVEAVAVLGRQFLGTRNEGFLADASRTLVADDELRRPTGVRREADAHDRADVRIGGRRQHAFVEALLGFQR